MAADLPTIAIIGAKGVGKRDRLPAATTIRAYDDLEHRIVAEGDPARLLDSDPPILIDEREYLPETCDLIVDLRMRPLALSERRFDVPSVSLGALLMGSSRTDLRVEDHLSEILASGLSVCGIFRSSSARAARRRPRLP